MHKNFSQFINQVKCDFCKAIIAHRIYSQKNERELFAGHNGKILSFQCIHYKKIVWHSKLKFEFKRNNVVFNNDPTNAINDDIKDQQLCDLYGYRYIK